MNINWAAVELANAPLAKQLTYLANASDADFKARVEKYADELAALVRERVDPEVSASAARKVLKARKCTCESAYLSDELDEEFVKATVAIMKTTHEVNMSYKLNSTDDGQFFTYEFTWE